MSAINWSEIAANCRQLLGSLQRGVLKITNFGFYVLFVPDEERSRAEREIAEAGMTIHGVASRTSGRGKRLFVAVVKADSLEKLRAVAHNLASH